MCKWCAEKVECRSDGKQSATSPWPSRHCPTETSGQTVRLRHKSGTRKRPQKRNLSGIPELQSLNVQIRVTDQRESVISAPVSLFPILRREPCAVADPFVDLSSNELTGSKGAAKNRTSEDRIRETAHSKAVSFPTETFSGGSISQDWPENAGLISI